VRSLDFYHHVFDLQRNAAANDPNNVDDGWIRDEEFDPPSPNPNSQQPPAAAQINAGEHGSGRLCFCF